MAFRVDKPWGSFVELMFFIYWAGVAQLVEQLICNQQVGGSSPFASSTFIGMLEGNLRVLTPPSWAAVLQYCRLVVEDFFLSSSIYFGEVPEWPKGTDCKSVGSAFGGSNPPLPIFLFVLGAMRE